MVNIPLKITLSIDCTLLNFAEIIPINKNIINIINNLISFLVK